MNIVELAKAADKENYFNVKNKELKTFLVRFAALIREEREWVDLTDEDRNVIEAICPYIDSHDFDLIGNAYIAAFKEKNK